MELQGKKVAFLGDSITEGVGCAEKKDRYTDVFGRISGAVVYNYGISATRIARNIAPSPDPQADYCFIDRVETMPEDLDLVVVFGGTNDFGHGDGGLGSFYTDNENTFYGGMHALCKKLLLRYPDIPIVFMTPLHRSTEDHHVNEFGHPRETLASYVAAQKEVCGYYGIPVLDLYATSGLTAQIPAIRAKYMPDGLHPSEAGALRIAEMLKLFLENNIAY